jgi:hypothetical protein
VTSLPGLLAGVRQWIDQAQPMLFAAAEHMALVAGGTT